ncbi:MAG TPA: biopolymer transporter ExbD [Candidatus Angelobacter sp.]|nr:biopolymer transporter ExbD [Candidatus Angelobacter sp.]
MTIAIRDEGAKVNSHINVTPMVDVMLVLLIIFMVITPLLPPGPRVELARASNPLPMTDADRGDALLVAINREGRVFLGNDQIDAADLTLKIRERLAARPDSRAFVKADARAHYKSVVEVVDGVRSAGVTELGLLTEARRQ